MLGASISEQQVQQWQALRSDLYWLTAVCPRVGARVCVRRSVADTQGAALGEP